MLLGLVFVVLVLSVAMMLAMFSSFFPFSNQYGNIAQYTSAYYTAMSAVERGALAVKYAGHSSGGIAHGFDGESGWKYIQSSNSNTGVGNPGDFWTGDFFSYGNSGATAMLWTVKSTTNRIPKLGEGDVEPILQELGYHSDNYNMLNYNKTEVISLNGSSAISDNKYYEYSNSVNTKITDISGEFRLNPYLFKIMSKAIGCDTTCSYLCKNTRCPGEKDQTRSENLPMIDWVLKGRYESGVNDIEFSVIPSESSTVSSTSYHVNLSRDSVIRKNNINQYTSTANIGDNQVNGSFGDTKTTVKFGNSNQINNYNIQAKQGNSISGLNIISRGADELKSIAGGFGGLLSNLNVKNPHLTFELINYLWNNNSSRPGLYPFLEYYFSFNGVVGMDRYYTIRGEGKVGKYNLTLQVKKPTMKDSSLGNFTIIF